MRGMAGHPSKLNIWHISADFPDPIEPQKTPVIRQLVALTSADANHFVISLNRETPDSSNMLPLLADRSNVISSIQEFDAGIALTYCAPAKGFMHETMLRRLSEALIAKLRDQPQPDLIIGHKLTIEGIIAERLAAHFKVPFALSIQGNTDTKILRARPDLTQAFARIFRQAGVVFPFAPWALESVEDRLGKRDGPTVLLPCPTELDSPLAPRLAGNGFVSAFHLKNHKLKNLAALIQAMARLQNSVQETHLDIIGGGTDADMAACEKLVGRRSNVRFSGPLDHSAIPDRFNAAIGFVLPSLHESFGLVFIEALFAGLPIIYPKGRAVDGYFDDMPFAIAVDPRDPHEISESMKIIIERETALKAEIARWQTSDHAAKFQRDAIASAFAKGLATAADGGS
nr:glycosyltransferase [Altererythrobacter lutimaris]